MSCAKDLWLTKSISQCGEKAVRDCPQVSLRASLVREAAAARAQKQGCHPWVLTSSCLESWLGQKAHGQPRLFVSEKVKRL